MTTDVIADMLTRIRNANQRYLKSVEIPGSEMKQKIAKILKDEGFIKSFKVVVPEHKNPNINKIVIEMKYKDKVRVIQGLKKISKPGLRVYSQSDKIPQVLNGLGIAIISTSEGLMTDKQARQARVGGEVLAFVW